MKKTAVLMLTSFFSFQVHAVVADKLQCEIKITDWENKIVSNQVNEFYVVRIPASSEGFPPGSTVKTGESSMSSVSFNEKGTFSASGKVFYQSAIIPIEGKLEGRQSGCIQMSLNFCKDHREGCSAVIASCIYSGDPMDPINGWSPTPIVDGVPVFNEGMLAGKSSSSIIIDGKGLVSMDTDCRYKGTFK